MVTIVITVHNREAYIAQCLDSALAQTYRELEIICVDDASTDSSPDILKRYAQRDSRITVCLFDANRGVQQARNHAISLAKGEYIMFLDDDDWLYTDCVERNVECFVRHPGADCVVMSEVRAYADGVLRSPDYEPFTVLSGHEAFVLSMPWRLSGNFMVRTSYQRRFPFDTSDRWFGDENTGRLMLIMARSVALSQGVYVYRMTPQSVINSVNIGYFSRLNAQKRFAEELAARKIPQELRARFEQFRWINVIGAYMRYYRQRHLMSPAMRNEALGLIRRARHRIDFDLAGRSCIRKFGYVPYLKSWCLFRIQEEIYFFLRIISNKMDIG